MAALIRSMTMSALFLLALSARASAQPTEPDYERLDAWLCHPAKPGTCVAEPATALMADGTTRREKAAVRRDSAIDCFYVYPTVSDDPGVSATGRESEAERRAARRQVARLGSVCRLYAPLYQQFTASQMMRSMAGEKLPPGAFAKATALAEADVVEAWKRYLAHDNRGRGVVLIGHSQGANLLLRLIKREVEGKPAQRLLVSAILPGSFVLAPAEKDVGGTFATIPACRAADQIGCVIVFNAFRASAPPPAPAKFPRDLKPLCTNPAALGGGPGILKPYLSSRGETIIPALTDTLPPLAEPAVALKTLVVSLPDLFRAECRDDATGVYLSVETVRRVDDHRTGALAGDWVFRGVRDPSMGLHLIDLDLVQGNLVEVIARQGAAYRLTGG